jgi:hypothetical protein
MTEKYTRGPSTNSSVILQFWIPFVVHPTKNVTENYGAAAPTDWRSRDT